MSWVLILLDESVTNGNVRMSIIQIPSEKTMSTGKWKCMLPLFSYLADICDCVQETLYFKVQLTRLWRRASQVDVDSHLGSPPTWCHCEYWTRDLSLICLGLDALPESTSEGWEAAAVQSATSRLGLQRVAGAFLLRMSPPAAQSPGDWIRIFKTLFRNTYDVYRMPPVQEGAGRCTCLIRISNLWGGILGSQNFQSAWTHF